MSVRYENEIKEKPPRAEWTRPEIERLVAGGAEGSADITSDGPMQPS